MARSFRGILFGAAAAVTFGGALMAGQTGGGMTADPFASLHFRSIGPAQASARTYMALLAPPGREAQLFGLYATTGRAVSFLAPTLVGAFTFWFGSDRAGIVGILVVLLAGLLAMWKVHPPERTGAQRPEPETADA